MNPATRLSALAASILLVLAPVARAADDSGREHLLLDFGWKFHLGGEGGYGLSKAGTSFGPGNPNYSDAGWRTVDLPHDWAVELPFDKKADAAHGFKPVGPGFPENSVAWYRRTFEVPASDKGKRLRLVFDGVYRDATVIVNGWFVGHHEGGYNGFDYDITDLANVGGTNVVAVRVDASQFEGWFYEGAGIYRHVWLDKSNDFSLKPDGIYVFSTFKDPVPSGPATVHMRAGLVNHSAAGADGSVSWEIVTPSGERLPAGSVGIKLPAEGRADVEQSFEVDQPRLWSPESPSLYKLVTTLTAGGRTLDRIETRFGIRTVAFDANRGFLLNGEPYTLKGTSNHQDHAGVGSALPDGVQYFRIRQLKLMGCNAYRTAHNPPTPELLDACDELGMIVMDENRQLGSDPRHAQFLEEQVLRDRNHASVGIWSLGNEEFDAQTTQYGRRVVATMQERLLRLDATRPVTCNAAIGDEYEGINEAIQVRGWSYHVGPDMDSYHRKHPEQPNVGSEQGSTVSTRGIYANDPVRGYVSAYDDNAPEWAQTAETWVTYFSTRPWMSGGFVWTGFDYRGEPTPYDWPCINSHFGILDTCGFPKDNFYYYQAWWRSEPVLHILPHWNWPGREGQPIDVRAESNCEEVELFLNGKSLGRQAMKRDSELKWKVPYEPGILSAKGFNGGKVVAEQKVETTGEPASVALDPTYVKLPADGRSVAVVTVSLKDAQGRVVPTAGRKVTFTISGPGRIIGVGNGDPSCHEPDKFIGEAASTSRSIGGWRWKKVQDPYPATMPEKGDSFDDSSWEAADVGADEGKLANRERAIYRARFEIKQSDLAAEAIEMGFGKIAGGISVSVNGHVFSGSIDGHTAAVYNVKSLLHVGTNVVVVPVASYGPDATGMSRGAWLRFTSAPGPVEWSRSTFNGLAEVIVQASRIPGTIRVLASSEGLAPGGILIQAEQSAKIPAVP